MSFNDAVSSDLDSESVSTSRSSRDEDLASNSKDSESYFIAPEVLLRKQIGEFRTDSLCDIFSFASLVVAMIVSPRKLKEALQEDFDLCDITPVGEDVKNEDSDADSSVPSSAMKLSAAETAFVAQGWRPSFDQIKNSISGGFQTQGRIPSSLQPFLKTCWSYDPRGRCNARQLVHKWRKCAADWMHLERESSLLYDHHARNSRNKSPRVDEMKAY